MRVFKFGMYRGKCEIRTHGTVTRSTVFETVPFDHSGNFPNLFLVKLITQQLAEMF